LYYDYHRWYDSTVGRFISVDPRPGSLSSPQSLNLYVYVFDSPVNKIDPTGEWGLDSLVSWASQAVAPVANTVRSIGSAALAVTTSAVNNMASATASVANTVASTTVSAATLVNVAKTSLTGAGNIIANGAGQLAGQLVSLGNSAASGLSEVGSMMWQTGNNAVGVAYRTPGPLTRAVEQGLKGAGDFVSAHVHISDMNKFAVGMLDCACLVALGVGIVASGGTIVGAIGSGAAAATFLAGTAAAGAAAASSPEIATGFAHLGSLLFDTAVGCGEGLSTVSFS
jgi:hypothetical protein